MKFEDFCSTPNNNTCQWMKNGGLEKVMVECLPTIVALLVSFYDQTVQLKIINN